MSILIRGMEMPETCDKCPLHHYHSAGKYVCEATPMFYPWNLANTKGIRKEWCPLIELPPHGRLIDADTLIARIRRAKELQPELSDLYENEAVEMLLWVGTEPTIIEAEEVQDGTL